MLGIPRTGATIARGARPPRLIVNADDFGISEEVNAGIVEAHREGIVTAASIMAVGGAFESAVAHCQLLPSLDMGVHLTLVGGKPLLRWDCSLVDGEGRFLSDSRLFLKRYLRGAIRLADIQVEWSAQIERVLDRNIPVSHLDSHQHVHALPGIMDLTLRLAKRYGIPFVRVPVEAWRWQRHCDRHTLRRLFEGATLRAVWIATRLALKGKLGWPAVRFLGFQEGGRLDRTRLLRLVRSLKPGQVYEIMCHPGHRPRESELRLWHYHHAVELTALIDPGIRSAIAWLGIELCSFAALKPR